MLNNIELINFVHMSLKETTMVLSWRNHESIKQWMYNATLITLENHLTYIDTLKDSSDKLYFLVKQDNNYIGVIDFTNINKHNQSSEFGLYANITLKGMGEVLLNCICDYAFNNLNIRKLIAEAFIENERAINLYKRFNFKETKEKIIKNKKILCMELKNENR